jgi:hypothetical protein
VTLLLFSLIAAGPYPAAQCTDLSGGTQYKVLIDEIEYDSPEGVKPAVSLDLLQSSVEGALEKVRQGILKGSSSKREILYLNCRGRHPSDTQFADDFIRSMVANHAILEFWGTLSALGGGQHRFDIRYVMFPVGWIAPPRPSEFASTQKTVTGKPSPQQVTEYLVNTRADLPAYFTVSAGLQAYADRKWDQAVRFLCEARTRLKKKPDQQDLMNLADNVANKAGAELRKSNLATGANLMSDAQATDYCMFATTR